jgi:hypothetical protein
LGSSAKRKAREKAVKKRLAKERHFAKMKRSVPPGFITKYGDPSHLAICGPVLKASWSVPPALAKVLTDSSRPIPKPIPGYMLIDTGAASTCIALDAAQELGLVPLRYEKSYGAGGLHELPVFGVQLTISIVDHVGRQTTVGGDLQAKGIPELGDYFRNIPIQFLDSFPKRMVGLIGRDLLRHATFVYKGSVGQFDFKLDLGSLAQGVPGT